MSTLIALTASALLAGAALHGLLVGPGPGWARGSWFQVALAAIAAAATASPILAPGTVTAMLVPAAVAGSLANMAESITDSYGAVTQWVTLLSYLAGLAFSISAILKFKQHKDNPTEAPGTKLAGVVMLLAGTLGTIFNSAAVQEALAKASGAG